MNDMTGEGMAENNMPEESISAGGFGLHRFSRTELLIGTAALEKLAASRAAVFGIGGVGGYVCEALARSGIGAMDLIDNDRVSLTNLNRQIIALENTIGRLKTEVMKERLLAINPEINVREYPCFVLPENLDDFPFEEYDYIVDAVDTVAAKLAIIQKADQLGIPVISAMGAGNKLDPGRFRVADIYETKICPLARVMRRELKKRGIRSLKVVYSEEEPITPVTESPEDKGKRRTLPGSIVFTPAVSGLLIASEVVRDLIGEITPGKK